MIAQTAPYGENIVLLHLTLPTKRWWSRYVFLLLGGSSVQVAEDVQRACLLWCTHSAYSFTCQKKVFTFAWGAFWACGNDLRWISRDIANAQIRGIFQFFLLHVAGSNNNNNRCMKTKDETKMFHLSSMKKYHYPQLAKLYITQDEYLQRLWFVTFTSSTLYYSHVTLRCLYHHVLTKTSRWKFIHSNYLIVTHRICIFSFLFFGQTFPRFPLH